MCGRISQNRAREALAPLYPGLLFTEDTADLPGGPELGPGNGSPSCTAPRPHRRSQPRAGG